jgi:hypothetical protein
MRIEEPGREFVPFREGLIEIESELVLMILCRNRECRFANRELPRDIGKIYLWLVGSLAGQNCAPSVGADRSFVSCGKMAVTKDKLESPFR